MYLTLFVVTYSTMSEPKYCGMYRRNMKIPTWGAAITVDRTKYYLGTWRDPVSAARAYDCMAVQRLGQRTQLNFPQYRATVHTRAPPDMRFCTKEQ
jgi:hypothetical protein